jgi:hypothetical protein
MCASVCVLFLSLGADVLSTELDTRAPNSPSRLFASSNGHFRLQAVNARRMRSAAPRIVALLCNMETQLIARPSVTIPATPLPVGATPVGEVASSTVSDYGSSDSDDEYMYDYYKVDRCVVPCAV